MVVARVLLGPGETTVSRKGRVPSWFGSSVVNYICGSCELMCCRSCLLCFACWMTKVSSTNLSNRWGLWGRAKGLNLELFHEQVGNKGPNRGIHSSTMDLFIIISLEEEVCAFEAKSRGVTVCVMDMLDLCVRSGSCCNFCLTMLMEGSMGTEVKRALIS